VAIVFAFIGFSMFIPANTTLAHVPVPVGVFLGVFVAGGAMRDSLLCSSPLPRHVLEVVFTRSEEQMFGVYAASHVALVKY